MGFFILNKLLTRNGAIKTKTVLFQQNGMQLQ